MHRSTLQARSSALNWIDDDLIEILARPCHGPEATKQKLADLLARPQLESDGLLEDLPKLLELHRIATVHDAALVSMLSIHINLCMGTIKKLSERSPYVENLYTQLRDGRAIGVYLATELGYGNNLFSLETTALYQPATQTFLLNSPSGAAYKFMPNTTTGPLPKIAVVMARLVSEGRDHGVMPFVLPLDDGTATRPGVTVTPLGHKPGYHLDNAITSFRDVELPFEALLQEGIAHFSRSGAFDALNNSRNKRFLLSVERVQAGKICMAATSIAATKAALWINYSYARQRHSFAARGSRPLTAHATYRNPLACDIAATLVYETWLDHFVADIGSNAMARLQSKQLNELALLKASSTWNNQDVLVRSRERCGAQGLFSANRIVDFYLGNNGAITAEGDNLVITLKAAQFFQSSGNEPEHLALLPYPLDQQIQHLLTGIAALKQRLRQNRHMYSQTEDLLLLGRWLGVRMAVLRCYEHMQRSDLHLALLETYLLTQLEHNAASLASVEAASSEQIKAWQPRRQHCAGDLWPGDARADGRFWPGGDETENADFQPQLPRALHCPARCRKNHPCRGPSNF